MSDPTALTLLTQIIQEAGNPYIPSSPAPGQTIFLEVDLDTFLQAKDFLAGEVEVSEIPPPLDPITPQELDALTTAFYQALRRTPTHRALPPPSELSSPHLNAYRYATHALLNLLGLILPPPPYPHDQREYGGS